MNIERFDIAFTEEAPSGVELRNDPRFLSIQDSLREASREARRNPNGELSLSVALDWDEVLDHAGEMAGDGRDLRLLVIVTRALANRDGFAGLAAGLDLLTQAVSDFWPSVHPEPRDAGNPGEAARRRRNAIAQLENENAGLLGDILMNVTLTPRGIEPVRGGDLRLGRMSEDAYVATLSAGLSDEDRAERLARFSERRNKAVIGAREFVDRAPDEAQAMISDLGAAIEAIRRLETAFNGKLDDGDTNILRLDSLENALVQMRATLADAQAADVPPDGAAEPEAGGVDASAVSAGGGAPAPAGQLPARLSSRTDVERCLGLIIDFYEKTEPSSPLPHLARRMKRMVSMNFVELMEEVAPSGMKEFRTIAGDIEK